MPMSNCVKVTKNYRKIFVKFLKKCLGAIQKQELVNLNQNIIYLAFGHAGYPKGIE